MDFGCDFGCLWGVDFGDLGCVEFWVCRCGILGFVRWDFGDFRGGNFGVSLFSRLFRDG